MVPRARTLWPWPPPARPGQSLSVVKESMKALVVYESMFGNTEHVAREVASGMQSAGAKVTVTAIAEADPEQLKEYDVVVAGAPTHGFSMSRPSSRDEAVKKGAHPEHAEVGMREWIERLEPTIGARPTFAVFDTRIGVGTARHFTGSAARRAAHKLRSRHRVLADDPASFYVGGTAGPLLPGEEVRARAWGSRLARSARTR